MSRVADAIRKLSIQAIALVPVALPVSVQSNEPDPAWKQALLDNCEQADNSSSIGTSWVPSLDTDRGGTSSISWFSTGSTFGVRGQIEPVPGSRGPGTAGMYLPLGSAGEEFDINYWDGIRITVKNDGAPLLLRIHSTEIENGDYFAAAVPKSNSFTTYSFSFRELGQVMSAQQPWSGRNVTGIELITFGWTSLPFSWEIEEISLYRNTDVAESTLS